MSRLFNSFWQAGFECSTHVLKTGKRLDLVASTGHDVFVEQDYKRLTEVGILTAREGLRWHLIEREPGRYDFSTVRPLLEAAGRSGIQILWDLFHFGWPPHLDIFDAAWVDAFGDLASAFGRFLSRRKLRGRLSWPPSMDSFLSWAGGDTAYLNPFATGRGAELKRQLVRGALRATDAVRAELANVRLIAPEPVIHIVGDPKRPDDVLQAAEYRSAMFEAWDMLSGRAQPELGGSENYLDIIGVNYYDRNQWWNHGKTIWRMNLNSGPSVKSWPKFTTATAARCSFRRLAPKISTAPTGLLISLVKSEQLSTLVFRFTESVCTRS